MDATSPRFDLKTLLEHAGWLRRLAWQLVRQGDVAEDVVQETWVAAVQSPPDPARPPRPWLAEVLRNVVRMHQRGEIRRQQRERTAAVASAEPIGAEAAVDRAQMQRLIAELVLGLDEPYRSTLILRFFDERSSGEIAQLHGVPAATVRWRLAEALRRLRQNLDERHRGDRSAWMVVLLPLGQPVDPSRLPFTSVAWVMTTKTKIKLAALGALALVSIGWGLFWRAPVTEGRGAAQQRVAATSPRVPALRSLDLDRGGAAALADAAEFQLSGTVTDSGAGPISGARITAIQAAPPEAAPGELRFFKAATDDKGDYVLRLRPGVYSLAADADGYPRKSQFLTLQTDMVANFRLEPGAQVLGQVVMDSTGKPVAGARVRAVPVERNGYRRPGVESDAAGFFTLPSVAAGQWRIEARNGGLVGSTAAVRVIPGFAINGLEVRVARGFSMAGRVVGVNGKGRADILVSAELTASDRLPGPSNEGAGVATDADGKFHIEGLAAGVYQLTAQPRGDGPRTYGAATIVDRDVVGVLLTLPAPVIVQGLVLDEAGQPVANAKVTAAMREDRAAGSAGPGDLSRGSVATTDAAGRFAFGGVEEGGLFVIAEREDLGAAMWGPRSVRSGDTANLTLQLSARTRLAGQVKYLDGTPAGGVTVKVESPAHRRGRESRTVADIDGRYALRGLIPGRARVVARRTAAGGFDGATPVTLTADGETRLDLTLPRAASIQGRVLLDHGGPAVGAVVVTSEGDAQPPPSHRLRGTVELDGGFVINDLDAGKAYNVWVDVPGATAHTAAVLSGTRGLLMTLRPPAR
jgi:RNA polymerase sigma factor (sigma-70 family)